MKVYISGPMSGRDLEETKERFRKAEKAWREHGYEVYNPVREDGGDHGTIVDGNIKPTPEEWAAFIKRDIDAVMDCDVICMLPDYIDSSGSNIEFYTAKRWNIPIVYMQEKEVENGKLSM